MVDETISWEGHLAGTFSGLVTAIILRNHGPQKAVKIWEDEEDYENEIKENGEVNNKKLNELDN